MTIKVNLVKGMLNKGILTTTDFSRYLLNIFFTTITIKIMYLINDSKNSGIFAI